ncbi:MAG: hypothetical protein FRX49_01510 [Trebouxia sp. A1-2]|nr:MAG: hypothetical protein FRX49_01510 [Trebouxia sp. A1-2]
MRGGIGRLGTWDSSELRPVPHISTRRAQQKSKMHQEGTKAEEGRERNKSTRQTEKGTKTERQERCWVSVTWMRLAAARALRSSLRAAMPLNAAWMVTAEADSRVPLAPYKRGRQALEAVEA